MSYADKLFIETVNDILEKGTSTEGQKIRPKWEDDGTPAWTKKLFGVVHKYDLSKEFPALTVRKQTVKGPFREILWIYQQCSNDIHDLEPLHIWDQWADETGSIGKAYGYQIGQRTAYKDIDEEGIIKAFPMVNKIMRKDIGYKAADYVVPMGVSFMHVVASTEDGVTFLINQMDRVIYDLVNNPFSRRIITTTYNISELPEMALQPCAYSMTYNVTVGKDGKLVLNGILNQRSQDMLAANGWNVTQYSTLLHAVAQVVGMEVGEFVHVIADCHAYNRHFDMLKTLTEQPTFDAPKLWINPEIKNFYDFTPDDVKFIDYKCSDVDLGKIPIAV